MWQFEGRQIPLIQTALPGPKARALLDRDDKYIYVGLVVWERRPIRILVDEAGTTPLVGMELLQGFELTMKVQRRGEVTIKRLRRRR